MLARKVRVRELDCGYVQCTDESTHGVSVLSNGETAIVVDRPPWGGIVVVTWCPVEWTSDAVHPETWTDIQLGAHKVKRRERSQHESRRAAADAAFQAEYPVLFDYLTALCFDNDQQQPRQTATVNIFAQDGCWKACLRDRAEGLCCWVASPTALGLFTVLEGDLSAATTVWRLDRAAGAELSSRRPNRKGT